MWQFNIQRGIAFALMISFVMMITCNYVVVATEVNDTEAVAGGASNNENTNESSGGNASDITIDDTILTPIKQILGVLMTIGAAICVGKCLQIGIMFVSSSAESKSDAKAAMIPWIVGAILLSSFSVIGNAVIDIIGKNNNGNVLDI